ncbi:MAG TPA: hypothetical protein EYN69_00290 [Flavobacteriales bacterium]|nr:hypothetical protein [Flavobacteriales bacterium]
MKLKITYTFLIAVSLILLTPEVISQTSSVKKPEFDALAKKMLKALKKMDQGKFLECFMNREEYYAMLQTSGQKIKPDEVDVAYMKAARKYADNFFLFAKKNDNDDFDWAEIRLDSLKYKLIKNRDGISSTDVYLYISLLDQPFKISLNKLMKVGDSPWKIMDDCRMNELPTREERQRIRAEQEAKLGDVNKVIRSILKYYRAANRDAFMELAGTVADQQALVDKMILPGSTDEQMEQTRQKINALVGEKYAQKIKETGDAFDQSIALIKARNAILSEAEIVWNIPVISTQLGMETVAANGFIRDHSVYFTFLINLVKVNSRWIINHTTSISFVNQGSSAASMINDMLDTNKYYKKL